MIYITTKEEWVAALRSGKYTQGKGYLNNQGLFCCLGVLCEISGVPKKPSTISSRFSYNTKEESFSTTGINDKMFPLIFEGNLIKDLLIHMNDDLDKSFNEIADYIETA